jgi:hypothetical protein
MDFIAPSDDDRSQAALHYVLGVFQAEEKAEAELGQETEDEEDEGEDTSDPVERQRRIDVLESISPALDYLRTPPYNLLVQATEKLADSCRDGKSTSPCPACDFGRNLCLLYPIWLQALLWIQGHELSKSTKADKYCTSSQVALSNG